MSGHQFVVWLSCGQVPANANVMIHVTVYGQTAERQA